MPLEIWLPLVAFVALALALVVVLRKAGEFLSAMREADGFRRAILDLGARIDTSLGGVIERVDAVRRHTLSAEQITDNLAAAMDAVARYADEVRVLHPPAGIALQRERLVAELERAARALQMVVHGCDLMTNNPGPTREIEAQTSIKRGYLNLIHAREAIGRVASEVAAAPLPGSQSYLGRRALASRSGPRDHTM